MLSGTYETPSLLYCLSYSDIVGLSGKYLMSKPDDTICLNKELYETYLAPTSITRTGLLTAAFVMTLRLRASNKLDRNLMLA